jgi:ssDNA-binding replication factor A large subunit
VNTKNKDKRETCDEIFKTMERKRRPHLKKRMSMNHREQKTKLTKIREKTSFAKISNKSTQNLEMNEPSRVTGI